MRNRTRPTPIAEDAYPSEDSVMEVLDFYGFEGLTHASIAYLLYGKAATGRVRRLRIDRVRRVCERLEAAGKVHRSGIEFDGIHWIYPVRTAEASR